MELDNPLGNSNSGIQTTAEKANGVNANGVKPNGVKPNGVGAEHTSEPKPYTPWTT